MALFLCGCERLAVLLQQGLHFCPSCQAVGFALEPAVFSSPLPLQNLQHPKEQKILRAGTYLTCNMWWSETGPGSYCGPSLATSSLGPARTNRPAPFSSPTVRKTKVSFSGTKTIEQWNIHLTNNRKWAVRSKSYLSVYFIDYDIHELIVAFFSGKK